jgi:hypothetical protein
VPEWGEAQAVVRGEVTVRDRMVLVAKLTKRREIKDLEYLLQFRRSA